MRRLTVLLAAAALLAATSAAAAPPSSRTHEERDITFTVPVCGFPVEVHVEGTFTRWTYLDESGTLSRERLHVEKGYRITWTNHANGRSLSTVLGGPVVIDYHADGSSTQVIAGRERLYTAPGEGPVAMQVGRIVFEVAPDGSEAISFVAGKWDLDIFPELCAYLA